METSLYDLWVTEALDGAKHVNVALTAKEYGITIMYRDLNRNSDFDLVQAVINGAFSLEVARQGRAVSGDPSDEAKDQLAELTEYLVENYGAPSYLSTNVRIAKVIVQLLVSTMTDRGSEG